MCVSAAYNAGNITAANMQNEFILTYGGEVTYSPVKDNWFAISINDDTYYHYAFYKLDGGIIKGFEFHFSGGENSDIYSNYIDHIYQSFKEI